MTNTSEIKIEPMKLPEDKDELVSWETKYRGTNDFKSIERYILEFDENSKDHNKNSYRGLAEVILVNYERFIIGEDERQFSYVARNRDGKIVAWILLDCFDMTTSSPELFLQYLMIHPKYQHSHIGTQILNEILAKPEKYVGLKPSNFFGYIYKTNIASKALFEKFGFEFKPMDEVYVKAHTSQPRFEKQEEQACSK